MTAPMASSARSTPTASRSLFSIVDPIFTEQGIEIVDGLTPEDLYTNEFIDESISLGF
ncbi:hypothetical protein GCM10025876_02230 [Demequina litorisediminis]|uniref:Uncharacterized protein n=2 Tax=Demequina litorisediminis TaxID=1849022 RepID=A0ABQ6IB90_9MICO|nr:hypothetical protein GCM10025876_02230 [Demequina litorisediminis]